MSLPGARILLVEQEGTLARTVQLQLERRNHVVDLAADRDGIVTAFNEHRPDLVILSLQLAGAEGDDLFQSLRVAGPLLVVLSPSAHSEDRVLALELGADDVVPSPPMPREVVARVEALLRRRFTQLMVRDRQGELQAGIAAVPRLEIDEVAQRVLVDGIPVRLTATELRLLAYFAAHPGHAVGRGELLEHVWGYTIGDGATVTVHVRRLRAKIERDPAHPSLIRTVWGTGYCFDPDDA